MFNMNTSTFVTNLSHQDTRLVDEQLWLVPSRAGLLLESISVTNLPPGKTAEELENCTRSQSEQLCNFSAGRNIWWILRYQTAFIAYPTWNSLWPPRMRMLTGLGTRMSDLGDATLADCLQWSGAE